MVYKEELTVSHRIKDKKQRNIATYKLRSKMFVQYENLLHKINTGPHHLTQKEIAQIIEKQLNRFDGEFYILMCYSILSNHVHVLIDTSVQVPTEMEEYFKPWLYSNLDVTMKRIKGPSAVYSNRVLGRNGQFWERESYDIYIRNEKMLINVVHYILNNPVKGRIVKSWEEHEWTYVMPGLTG